MIKGVTLAIVGLKVRVAVNMLYMNALTSLDIETKLHNQALVIFLKKKRDFVTIQNINTYCF